MNSATYTACGKAIVLGEHFVVGGGGALAVALPGIGTTVDVTPSPGSRGYELQLQGDFDERDRALAQRLVERAAELCGGPQSARVGTRSTIPIGCGLGSSASFAVALVGALLRARGERATAALLRERAHALETLVHGTPSGIDDAVIASGGALYFRRGAAPVALTPGRPLELVFASVGRPAPTREAVAMVAAGRRARPAAFATLEERAAMWVERGRRAFVEGDLGDLGASLDGSHELLAELGVSTPALDTLISTARQSGALGAKLTGAGLGGFMLALVEGPSAVAATLEALTAAGAVESFACRVTCTPATQPDPRDGVSAP